MNQNELNRAVAKATGEPIETIAEMGFTALMPVPYEREPNRVDWDQVAASQKVSLQRQRRRTQVCD